MNPKIKITYTDFWHSFDKANNYFTCLLSEHYEVELADDPDFLIYSCYDHNGQLHWANGERRSAALDYRQFSCIRIFYTSENVRPDFRECDYAFSFDYPSQGSNYRLPFYGLYEPKHQLPYVGLKDTHPLVRAEEFDPEAVLASKSKFCNFIYSNRHAQQREQFFTALSKYKVVDAGGKRFNNVGGPVTDKMTFMKDYKFTIAFENYSQPGYTTEKIYQPMLVNSMPIYWGNLRIGEDFNTDSFLNYHDFDSEEDLIDRIIELDQNDDLYLQYLSQPYFKDNIINPFIDPNNVLQQFHRIFESQKKPVAKHKRYFFYRALKDIQNSSRRAKVSARSALNTAHSRLR